MSNYFGTGTVVNTPAHVDVPVYEGFIEPTGDALMAITAEGVLEGYQLQAALHIADATIAYTAVHESAQSAEIVLEGVIGSTVGKIKDGLKKLWSKIKAWFKSVTKSIQVMFTKGKDFVNKFKKEIESKTARGFEYEGFVWTVEKGNAAFANASKALQDVIESEVGSLASDIDGFAAHAMKADGSDAKDTYNTNEVQEAILKAAAGKLGSSATELSELKEELAKEYRNGTDEKEELKEFSKVTRAVLIDLIKEVDKKIKVVTDNEKQVDKTFTAALKALDKAETAIGKKTDGDFSGSDNSAQAKNRAKVVSAASKMGTIVRYGQAVNSALASTAVDSVKAAASEAERVLKSFVRYKGVKESFEGDIEEGATDVMESFIKRTGLLF